MLMKISTTLKNQCHFDANFKKITIKWISLLGKKYF